MRGGLMKYLICKECRGYYRLKENEYVDDFDSCTCGGELEYITNLSKYIKEALNNNAK